MFRRHLILVVSLIFSVSFLFLFVFAVHAHAAILLVQSSTFAGVNSNGVVSSGTLTFSNPVTTGDFVVIGCGVYPGSIVSITDSKNNAYQFYPTSSYQSYLWYAANVTGGFTTTTATFGQSSSYTCRLLEFSGVAASPTDASGTATGTGTTGTGATLTPSQSGDLFVGINTVNNTPPQTLSSTAWTDVGWTSGAFSATGMAYLISPTTNTQTPIWTWSGSTQWGVADAAFKAATTPPTITSFSASPSLVASSGTSTLSWNISNASSVAITATGYGGLTTSTLIGSTTVNPTASTTYLLTASSTGGTVTSSLTVTVDASPPTAPTNLTLSSVSTSTLTLTWSSSTDSGGSGLASYSIFRCQGSGCTPASPALATTTTSTSPSYQDTNLTPNTSYTYALTATDGVGNQSATSTTVSTTTQALPAATPSITVMVPAGYHVGLPPGYLATSVTSTSSTNTTPSSSAHPPQGTGTSSSSPSSLALLQTLVAKLLVLQTQLAQLQGSGADAGTAPASPGVANQQVPSSPSSFTRDLQLWDMGPDVTLLQQFLIQQNTGPYAQQLKAHGVTQTFGILTYQALREYQRAQGINPTGYFGGITKAAMGGL